MLTEWRAALRAQPGWWYFYAVGFVLLVGGVGVGYVDRHSLTATSLITLAMIMGAAGFLSAVFPALVLICRSPIGLPLLALVHLLVGMLAAMLARDLVADALQLPPHDFDLTVAILTLVYYPPLWLTVATAISLLLGILGMLAMVVLRLPSALLGPLITPSSEGKARSRRLLAHSVAAMALALSCAQLADILHADTKTSGPAARLIAYYVDYHTAAAYPGIPPGEKIRLHENGVVSIARRNRLEVTIEVTTVKLP